MPAAAMCAERSIMAYKAQGLNISSPTYAEKTSSSDQRVHYRTCGLIISP